MEPRVRPREHGLGVLRVEDPTSHEEAEHRAAERFGQRRRVVHGPGHEGAVGPKAAIRHQHMNMRMPVRAGTMGLDARHDADREPTLAGEGPHGGRHGPSGDARQVAQQRAPIETPRSQALGDGEHHLAVRHRCEERLLQPQRPEGQPLGMTARTEVAALAREGEEVLVGTRGAAHARKAVVEDAAGEELVGHVAHDGAPGAIRASETLVVDGLQRAEVVLDERVQR